ncbi:MAG: S-methyl-5-thioribose-1-phosphate isomerase [Thermodesulfobacteriota bacterium]|nr:MAG: S-methyl-5-thioribose-1-phosphate isomerase [Thermodesulfobacteriota bacterium]
MFKTIEWKKDSVVMIDQRLLPGREVYRTYRDYRAVADAIKKMVVRGAPAIGVAGAMGVAVGALRIRTNDKDKFKKKFEGIADVVASARPTAVNLSWAVDRMTRVFEENANKPVDAIKKILVAEACSIHDEDIVINKEIGRHGGALLKKNSTVLTHCNAGALATAGYGTALGVIRGAIERGRDIKVLADETRPFLQGSRLTAWELMKDGIDVTLITDNMAGHFMKEGLIDAVVVGADRIASNGDVANKIGTYTVAVLAREHKLPFYVAAPLSTIDMNIKSGHEIPIEERDSSEVTHMGRRMVAPKGVKVRNPVFDVTPARLVTAIITEKGVVKKPFRSGIKKLFLG